MVQDLRHLGITDLDQKHILTCHEASGGPRFSLLWRTTGPRGKPLPKIGDRFRIAGLSVIVERIDPPGTTLEFRPDDRTLIITPNLPT